MIVVSNSSPLIALSCLDRLKIFAQLFGKVYIPETVYYEVVIRNTMPLQKQQIIQALDHIVYVRRSTIQHQFTRTLDVGEVGVLNLAINIQAALVLLDDRKVRNEAKELGLQSAMTSAVLQWAVEQRLIPSYYDAIQKLASCQINYTSVPLPHNEIPEYRPEIGSEVYASRLTRLRTRMQQAGLDALVIYADREHAANFSYIAGFGPRFEEALLLVLPEGDDLMKRIFFIKN